MMITILVVLLFLLIFFSFQGLSDKVMRIKDHPYHLDKELKANKEKRFQYHYENKTLGKVICPACQYKFNSTIGDVECPNCQATIFVDVWD